MSKDEVMNDLQYPVQDEHRASCTDWCIDCPLYDKANHNCPRFNKVIPETLAEVMPRWIPVTERTPDEDFWSGGGDTYSDDVLMTVVNEDDDEHFTDYGHTTDGRWFSNTENMLIEDGFKVVAWMPKPEPYKGGER